MSLRVRRMLLIAASLVVVAALVIVGIVLAPTIQNNARVQVRNEVKQQLTTTQIAGASNNIIEQSHVVSTMVGPGTTSWWKVETAFVPQWGLDSDWAKLSAKPSTIGFTLFYSEQDSNRFIASPALFLAYNSKADAQKANTQLNSGALRSSEGAYNAFVLDKTVVIAPTSVLDGFVVKNIQDFKTAQNAANNLDKGYWYVSGNGLNEYMKNSQASSDNTVYLNLVKRLGFNIDAKPGNWYGTSTDGLNWQGRMFAVDSSALWNAADLQVAEFYSYLNSTAKTTGKPTQAQIEKAQAAAEKNGVDPKAGTYTFFYSAVPMQSVISSYFAIATSTKVSGAVVKLTNSSQQVKVSKTDDPNKITFTVDPNVWFNALNSPSSSDVWHLFNFSQAQLTFYKNDQTRLDIKLVQ